MSSRAQHYREAERLIEETHDETCVWADGARERMLAEAQVRAQLSTMGDNAYEEYLDLLHTESLREEVVGMPDQGSRDWLIGDDDEMP